jgi:hypothetical protein
MATDPKQSFYRTALLGLLAQEHHAPTKRRFGPDADAAWSIFHGHLDAADRIDLLLRDAAVKHPAAFAPRTVFSGDPTTSGDYNPTDLPDDEPFGPGWQSPFGPDTGRQLWARCLEHQDATPNELWQLAVEAWGITTDAQGADIAPDAATRVLVIGAPAIAALVPHFLGNADLDWGRQVLAVASTPAGSQLAGVAPLLVGSPTPARVLGLNGTTTLPSEWHPDQTIRSATLTNLESAFLGSPA